MNSYKLLVLVSKLNKRNYYVQNNYKSYVSIFSRSINLLSYPDQYLTKDWNIRVKLVQNNRRKQLNYIHDDTLIFTNHQAELINLLDSCVSNNFNSESIIKISKMTDRLIVGNIFNCGHLEALASFYCRHFFDRYIVESSSNNNLHFESMEYIKLHVKNFINLFMPSKNINDVHEYDKDPFIIFLLSEFYKHNITLNTSYNLKDELLFWLKLADFNKEHIINYNSAISSIIVILAKNHQFDECFKLINTEISNKSHLNSNDKYYNTRLLSSLLQCLFNENHYNEHLIRNVMDIWTKNFNEPIHFHDAEKIVMKQWLNYNGPSFDLNESKNKLDKLREFINNIILIDNKNHSNTLKLEIIPVLLFKPIFQTYLDCLSFNIKPIINVLDFVSNYFQMVGSSNNYSAFNKSTPMASFLEDRAYLASTLLKYTIFDSYSVRRILKYLRSIEHQKNTMSQEIEERFDCHRVMITANSQLSLYNVIETYKHASREKMSLSPSKPIWLVCFNILRDDFMLKLERRFNLTYFDALIRIFYEIEFTLTNPFVHGISEILTKIIDEYHQTSTSFKSNNNNFITEHDDVSHSNHDYVEIDNHDKILDQLIIKARSKNPNYLRLHNEPWKFSQSNIVRILTSKTFQKGHLGGKPLSILFLLRLAPPNQNLWLAAIVGRFLVERSTSKEQLINMAICQDILKRSCSNIISDCFVAFLSYLEGHSIDKFPPTFAPIDEPLNNNDYSSVDYDYANISIYHTLNDAIIDKMFENMHEIFSGGFWKYLSSLSYLTYRIIDLNQVALNYLNRRTQYPGDFTLFLFCLASLNNKNVEFSNKFTKQLNLYIIKFANSNLFNKNIHYKLFTPKAVSYQNSSLFAPINIHPNIIYEWPPFPTLLSITTHSSKLNNETLNFDDAYNLLSIFLPYRCLSIVANNLARFIAINYKSMLTDNNSDVFASVLTGLIIGNNGGLSSSLANNILSVDNISDSFNKLGLNKLFLSTSTRCLRTLSGPLSTIYNKLLITSDSNTKMAVKMEKIFSLGKRYSYNMNDIVDDALSTNSLHGLIYSTSYNLAASTLFSFLNNKSIHLSINSETALIFILGVIAEEVYKTLVHNRFNTSDVEERAEKFTKLSQFSKSILQPRIIFSEYDIDIIYSTFINIVINNNYMTHPIEYILNKTKYHSTIEVSPIWPTKFSDEIMIKKTFSVFKQIDGLTSQTCHSIDPLKLFLKLGFDDPSTLSTLKNELVRQEYPDLTLYQLQTHLINFSWSTIDKIFQSTVTSHLNEQSINILQSLGYKV